MMNETTQSIGGSGQLENQGSIAFNDPWDIDDKELERRDSWLLSYIDILTLFLTLLVVLLALQPKEVAPMAETQPGNHRYISPIPIERPQQNQVAQATETGLSTAPWPTTGLTDTDGQAGNQSAIDDPGIPLVSQISFNPKRIGFPDEGIPQIENLPEPAVLAAQTQKTKQQTAEQNQETKDSSRTPNDTQRSQRLMDELAELNLGQRLRISQVEEGVQLEVSDTILFSLGSTDLKPEGQALLEELHQIFSRQKGRISIEGHTDDRPIANLRFPSNWELSSGRATQVARYLIAKGMAPERLRAIGYADTRPLQSNNTDKGRSRNRRVALLVELSEPDSQ